MKELEYNNIKIIVGETAKENTELVIEYKEINSNYYWFHLEDLPSAHVFLLDEKPTKEHIEYCCKIVKYYSKHRTDFSKKYSCSYCKLSQVTPQKQHGLVTINNPSRKVIPNEIGFKPNDRI